VPPEARACNPQLASDPPAPSIEVTSVNPVHVPPVKVPTSDPSQAPMVNHSQVSILSVPVEALPTPPDSALMVIPIQVTVVSAPIKAQPAPGDPKPDVPHFTMCVPVLAQWKPELAGLRKDKLRRLIAWSTRKFESSDSWEHFTSKCRDPRGYLHPNVKHLPHQAAHLLDRLQVHGATVATKTAPRSLQHKLTDFARGSHHSAIQHVEFLCEEFIDMINKGQWVMRPASVLLDERNLRLYPLGMVPHRDRCPRKICDYSFFLIKDDTIELFPKESMQFGCAIFWILQRIALSNPCLGPVFLSKIDIADSLYRMGIHVDDVPKLGIIFPTQPGEEHWIGLPIVLPIVCKQPPPLFTAATKTVVDLANARLLENDGSSPHRLEQVLEFPVKAIALGPTMVSGPGSLPPPLLRQLPVHQCPRPVKNWDVYVDDFMGPAQGNSKDRRHVKRVLLESLDSVMQLLDKQGGPHRQEPASTKKMLKGDETSATRKVVLGWMIGTINMTIQMPDHRVHLLFKILDSNPASDDSEQVNKWQKLLGELHSMLLYIPGGKGLFSVLQNVMKNKFDQGKRVGSPVSSCHPAGLSAVHW
jgi:hypothetical protein